ncbi:MAG: SdpI family protein, partial [Christensenellaceae bacterium]|nr:SdpI family protein [Christensenellaceae bacterium]
EENWNKTHRFAGWLWMGCGLVIIPLAFLGNIFIPLALLISMVAAPIIYSYALHRRGI